MRLLWTALAAVLPACAFAGENLTCVTKAGAKYSEPQTLTALVDCQKGRLDAATAAYRAKHKADPPPELVDSWQDRQRAAVSDYLNRHPNRASLDRPNDAPPEDEAAKDKGAKPDDAPKNDNGGQAGMDDLNRRLRAESDGGKKGVTPEMAQQVRDYLKKNQGSVSPDMQRLLESVSKDGVKLTPDTMGQLQGAAKQAKGQGLDLNTDKNTEDFLLNDPQGGQAKPDKFDKSDFKFDKSDFNTN